MGKHFYQLTSKGITFRIYKELQKLNPKKTKLPINNQANKITDTSQKKKSNSQ